MDPGNLGYSVAVFCIEATLAIIVIVARRHPVIGGELGGPVMARVRGGAEGVIFSLEAV